MSIYLTGASGFIGKNLVSYFGNKVQIKKHVRGSEFLIKQKVVQNSHNIQGSKKKQNILMDIV